MKVVTLTTAAVLAALALFAAPPFTPPSSVPYTGAAYLDRAKLINSTGGSSLAAYASPAACPMQVNLLSQNVSYSAPVLSLPGRAGLGVSLSLHYNSKVWIKSGSTIYFDGDNGWPAVGWRLGYGRIDGKYTISSVDYYFYVGGDGSVHPLKYNATSGLYESRDSTWMDFNDSTGVLRMKDGTQITYAVVGSYLLPTQVKDRNGNYITVNYAAAPPNAGFEDGSTSWSGWGGGDSIVTNASAAHSGSKYLQLTTTGAHVGYTTTQAFNVTPGQQVTFGGWAYRESGTGGNVHWVLAIYDSGGTPVGYPSTNNVSAAQWTYGTTTYTMPSGAATVKLYAQIYQAPGSVTARFDDGFVWVGQQISSIVDTAGRSVNFSYNSDGTLNTITKSGFNNASRTWTFGYTNKQLSYSFHSSLTVSGPSSGSYVKVLSSITYPNGTSLTFDYNGYAQLTAANQWSTSGSYFRGGMFVNWNSAPGGGWTDSPIPASIGNHDGVSANTWSLSFGSYTTTVTDPASVAKTTTFISSSGAWDDGLPDTTNMPSTSLRTTDNTWGHDGNNENPRITTVTTTLKDPNVSNISSKVEYDYTSYGNVSEVREYDYGLTLKRKATTTYETGTNYISRHILGLPLTTIVYDGSNNAKSRTVYAYDGSSLTSATGASNHDDTNYGTGFAYRGLVTTTTRYTNAATPSGAITNTATYDMLGNLRTESADCCVTKTYNYSSTTQFIHPDSIVRGSGTTLTTSATYDSHTGLVATSTDENNKTTTYAYDTTDRLTSTTRPDSTVISTSFDDASATPSSTTITPIEASKDRKQTSETDGLGRGTRVIIKDTSNNIISKVDTVYDSVGRQWKVSNPYTGASASYWTETTYDALGRTFKIIPPDGSSSANHVLYEYANDVTTVTDPTGRKRKSKSDALGRQIQITEPDPTNNDTLNLTTDYTYDPMNNLTQISQGSQTRSYVFDGLSRKTSETTPEAGDVTYVYNNDSLLTSRTDERGVVTTYSYDSSLNRLTSISYNNSCCTSTVPSTPSIGYTYGASATNNNNGRVTQMTDGLGEENYTYDSLGRLTQVQKKVYNVTFTTSYTYNLASEIVNMTYPSGRVVKQEYDAIGRLQNVKNNSTSVTYAGSATYNQAQQLTGFSYGNSVSASFGYSTDRHQFTSLSYSKSGTLFGLSYNYDQDSGAGVKNNGQIAAITDNVQSGRTMTYTYDSLHRLKTAVTNGSGSYPQWGLQWTYDRYGNRTQQSVTHGTAPSNTVNVSATTNRITDMGSSTFYYDLNGNLTQDDLYKYKYDAENRMVEIRSLADFLIGTYAFDGHSLRIIKVIYADRTWYIYAGTELISEYEDAASSTYSSGTSAGSAPADSASTLLYQHDDQLTSRMTTDNDGDVSNQQGHYPFGELWYAIGGADPSVQRKYTTYMRDAEVSTGRLNYAVFREHSGRIGRFHMPDPVHGNYMNPQRLNRYAYVRNDPSNRLDPLGLNDFMNDPEWDNAIFDWHPGGSLSPLFKWEAWMLAGLAAGGGGAGGYANTNWVLGGSDTPVWASVGLGGRGWRSPVDPTTNRAPSTGPTVTPYTGATVGGHGPQYNPPKRVPQGGGTILKGDATYDAYLEWLRGFGKPSPHLRSPGGSLPGISLTCTLVQESGGACSYNCTSGTPATTNTINTSVQQLQTACPASGAITSCPISIGARESQSGQVQITSCSP